MIGLVVALGGLGVASAQVAEPGPPVSGVVVTNDLVPVAGACVYALQPGGAEIDSLVGFAITASDGSYEIDTIPAGVDVVIGFVGPFTGPDGPCTTTTGPPPVPAPGALQAVWYQNVFLDLSNPQLGVDPYAVGVQAGATPIQAGATGIDGCLTTAEASVVPRPTCSPSPTPDPVPAASLVISPNFTG